MRVDLTVAMYILLKACVLLLPLRRILRPLRCSNAGLIFALLPGKRCIESNDEIFAIAPFRKVEQMGLGLICVHWNFPGVAIFVEWLQHLRLRGTNSWCWCLEIQYLVSFCVIVTVFATALSEKRQRECYGFWFGPSSHPRYMIDGWRWCPKSLRHRPLCKTESKAFRISNKARRVGIRREELSWIALITLASWS